MCKKEIRGFTLTELMVVVLIIGVLTAVAIPVTFSIRQKATHNSCLQNQQIIHTESVRYYADHGVYPEDVKTLVESGYLQSMPLCEGEAYIDIKDSFATCPNNSHIGPLE